MNRTYAIHVPRDEFHQSRVPPTYCRNKTGCISLIKSGTMQFVSTGVKTMAEANEDPAPGSAKFYWDKWRILLPFDPERDYIRHQEIRQLFEEASWKR